MTRRSILAAVLLVPSVSAAESYERSIEQYRQEMEEELKSDTGWLMVAGLFWLQEGENTVGSAEDSRVVLPYGPPRLGVIELSDGRAVLRYADAAREPVELKPDTSDKRTVIEIGEARFWVIERGERFGIRLLDPNNERRREFTHRDWYPVKPEYRITGRFLPYNEPRPFRVPSAIGPPQDMESPGEVELVINGETVRLMLASEDDSLWVIFRDATSGRTTYGAGRFLYTDLPEDGKVVVDFNKAYSPPCAFTPYATCPLPPKENRMEVPVEAGEKYHGEHH